MKKLMALALMGACLSSCVWSTPSGIRELNAGYVGAASLEKEDTPFHELERHREEQKTIRLTFGGKSEGK